MVDVRWLDEVPAPLRWGLVGAAIGASLVGTLAPADGLGAAGIAAAVTAALIGTYVFVVVPQRLAASPTDPLTERDRGILARRALKLVEDDPSFSLPDLVEQLRDELLPTKLGGPVDIGPVDRLPPTPDTPDQLELRVAYQTPATSDTALVVLGRIHGQWAITDMQTGAAPPTTAATPSPWVVANRRALLARSEAFDQAGLEALVARISALLDEDGADLSPYTTATGGSSVRWWRANGGLPATSGALAWVAVLEDAWYERVDLRHGDRVLGLLRTAGEPEAPWKLWRVLRASETEP